LARRPNECGQAEIEYFLRFFHLFCNNPPVSFIIALARESTGLDFIYAGLLYIRYCSLLARQAARGMASIHQWPPVNVDRERDNLKCLFVRLFAVILGRVCRVKYRVLVFNKCLYFRVALLRVHR
jgi:hypothetical protein